MACRVASSEAYASLNRPNNDTPCHHEMVADPSIAILHRARHSINSMALRRGNEHRHKFGMNCSPQSRLLPRPDGAKTAKHILAISHFDVRIAPNHRPYVINTLEAIAVEQCLPVRGPLTIYVSLSFLPRTCCRKNNRVGMRAQRGHQHSRSGRCSPTSRQSTTSNVLPSDHGSVRSMALNFEGSKSKSVGASLTPSIPR